MKRILGIGISAFMILGILAGCSGNGAETTPTPVPDSSPTLAETPAPSSSAAPGQIQSTQTPQYDEPEENTIAYINRELGFVMEMPLSWMGRVVIVSEEINSGVAIGPYIIVYQRATYEAGLEGGPDGRLFSIGRYTKEWTEENPPSYSGGSILVLSTEEYNYFAQTPSDVRWIQDDPESEADYRDLYSQCPFVWSHVRAWESAS